MMAGFSFEHDSETTTALMLKYAIIAKFKKLSTENIAKLYTTLKR